MLAAPVVPLRSRGATPDRHSGTRATRARFTIDRDSIQNVAPGSIDLVSIDGLRPIVPVSGTTATAKEPPSKVAEESP